MSESPFAHLRLDILDSFHEGCQVIGFDYTYRYVNETVAAQGRRKRTELLGRTMMEMYPGIEQTEMFTVLRRCMENRTPQRIENQFAYPDGGTAWFDLRFVPVPEGVFILSLDITERKLAEARRDLLEKQLRQAQRLETIGRLAGGIAHDFNNLLAVIIGHSEFGFKSAPPESPTRRNLREILEAAESAARLTHQLLAFSRRQILQPEPLSLNAVVEASEHMVRRLLGEHIDVVTVLHPDLGAVLADPGQMQQVLLNLVANARDAMAEGGKLTIATGEVDLDETYVSQHAGASPGRHAMLSVTDTGIGMDAETLTHIFDPFFTTKAPGKGTGLGLASVYGIVKQSGGSVWAYSEPDRGTVVKVYLPVTEAEARAAAIAPAAVLPAAEGETILLVEDHRGVREVACAILEDAGYTVLAAGGPEEALWLCGTHAGPLHLLLTDVVMPSMGGRDLAAHVQERHPSVRVLYMSGYVDDDMLRQGKLERGAAFIDKPFTRAALTGKVRQVLDG